MKDENKTKQQLINELLELRQRIAELETLEAEHKNIEESLRESEIRYRALFDRSLYCVYVHDFEGRFIDANDAALNLLGYKSEEIPSVDFSKLLEEDQLAIVFKNMEEFLQTGSQKGPVEYKLRKKDGGYVWIEAEGSLIYKEGKPYAIQGIARDITERKLAEENLRFSKKYLESILSNSLDLMITIKKDGTIGYTNHQIDIVTGYQKDEVLGKYFINFIPEHQKEFIIEKWRELNEGIPGIFETEIIKADGTPMHCLISSSTVEGFDEFLISIKDNSERKHAEEAIRESEEKFRLAFEDAKDAIFWADSITGLIINCNKAAESLLEKRKEEIVGHHQTTLHPSQKMEYYVNLFKKHITQGETIDDEAEVITRSGTIKPVHITVSITLIGGKQIIQGIFRDITDRKRAEKALIDSEEQYRRMVSAITAYTYSVEVKDGQAVFTYHSIGCLPVTGYKPEDYESEPYLWYTMIHPEDQILVGNSLNEIFAGRKVPPIEHRLIRRDGSIVWVRNTMVPYTDEKDRLIRYDGLIEDINERKQAEKALRESEGKFRAISNTAADAILVMDNKGKILYWNPSAERMFGYAREEAIGEDLHLFLAPERYHDAYAKGFRKFIETGKGPAIGNTLEFVAIRKDGIEFPIEVSTSAIQVKGQWHSVGIVRDITERKIAEKALQKSEQNYRSLFEESKDVVYISTPEGKFLDINPAGVKLFGYSSKEEILQIDITRDLYENPGDREIFQQTLAKHGYTKDYEVVFTRKDGEQLIVLLTATAVHGENGNTIAYRGIMKDITERKRLEQQLLQAQKMEAIGQLAGGVAHDFNNILTAIIGYGSLLKIETSEDDLLRSYVTQILNSAERAANLTKALLAFSRRQIIRPKPVNLNEIITVLEKLLSRLIGEDIELSTVFTDKDVTVMADSTQIEQVLMNLATNARDAMPDGGSLTIGTELVELNNEFIKAHGFGRPGFYALISVEDTGQGMDEKTKEKIFEPFFTTKEVGKGTGLGLAMVYGIIKQHDGYINVYSEPDKGTAFKIYLPLIKLSVEEVKLADIPIIKGGTDTILIAEDDAQVRGLTKEVLEGYGYKVMEAVDGNDAIKIFNENKDKIQLLFLDVIMPKKNGKEVYDEIKKVRPDIKAIFTSGYNADIIHKKGILEEGLDFIAKPISPEEFLRKVREVLDK